MSRFSYNRRPLGLYLHIPFCVKKCGYCDFYSVTDDKLKKGYVSALLRHIREYGKVCGGYTADTVYVGGGTPTCLGARLLGKVIQEAKNRFPVAPDAEITVECNPESTDKKILDMMKKQGVNRLSFGVQSADDNELKALGRVHTFDEVKTAVALAKERGFINISLDLMYGLPGQTKEGFLDSVAKCLVLEPTHLSCYSLTLEPATPMGRLKLPLPDDDAQADVYLALCEFLREKGFEHYEISNFAKPGYSSRHNRKYWDLSDYIGLGPGAHSFMNGKRFEFARDVKAYINREDIMRDEDEVPSFQRQGEYIMVRLRTSEGVDFIELERRYNIDSTPYEEAFRSLVGKGLVEHKGTCWRLTEKGFLVSNSIINIIIEAGQKGNPALPKTRQPV